jgi:hypothetical protein
MFISCLLFTLILKVFFNKQLKQTIMQTRINKNTLLLIVSFFIILISACKKDDDSSTNRDPNACINANEELMSCYNCCAQNGYEVGDLDLITMRCECSDLEDEDDNNNNNNNVCSSATSYEACQECCRGNDFTGTSFDNFNGCQCFD